MKRILTLITAVVVAAVGFAGCNKTVDEVAFTVNGAEAYVSELTFYYNATKLSYEYQYGEGSFETYKTEPVSETDPTTQDDSNRQRIVDILINKKVLEAVFNEEGLKITADEEKNFKEYVIEQLGEEQLEAELKLLGITQDQYFKMITNDIRLQKLKDHFYGESGSKAITDQKVKETLASDYVHVKHILVKNVDDSGTALTGDALAAKQTKYNEVKAKVDAGGDFEALIKEYNEDAGEPDDGYVFRKRLDEDTSGMDPAFEETSFAIGVGEVGVCESQYGWHIIKKYTTDDEFSFKDKEETIRTELAQELLAGLIAEKLAQYETEKKIIPVVDVLVKNGYKPSMVDKTFVDPAPTPNNTGDAEKGKENEKTE